jgi:hypothetical protein
MLKSRENKREDWPGSPANTACFSHKMAGSACVELKFFQVCILS